MPSIDENVFRAFREHLRKEAGFADAVARATPRLKNVGALGGAGLTLGAIGGGGLGAVHGYRQARGQGASIGEAALSGLGGGLRGAGQGALAGGLAGSVAGGLSPSNLSGLTQRGGPLGAGARFGQRQLHGLTGMLSPQELEGVRGGAHDALQHSLKMTGKPGMAKADKALRATEAATGIGPGSMNLTSVPGYVGALKQHGVGKVLSTSVKEQLANQPAAMTALMVGAPTVAAGKALAGKDEYNSKGQARGERAGEAIGGALGGVVGSVMPLGGQVAAGAALGGAGKVIGRSVDRLRGKRPTPGLSQPGMTARTLEPTESQNTPSERVMSPNAAGQRPEIGI
jgi:hypothetical protein